MGGKEKGGREVRKPKLAKNVKQKGQTPDPVSAVAVINHTGGQNKK
jgi:hypothetical protein